MARTSNVFARVEPEIKEQAEQVLDQLGIPMSNAVSMFLRQIVLQRGIPLQARLKIQREHTQSSARAPAGFSFGSYFIYLSAVKPYGSIAPRDSAT